MVPKFQLLESENLAIAQTRRGISNGGMMVSITGVMLSSRNDFGLPERILHFSCVVLLMTYEKSSKRTHLQNASLVLRFISWFIPAWRSKWAITSLGSQLACDYSLWNFKKSSSLFFSTSNMTLSLSSLSFSCLEVESSRLFTICHIAAVWVLGFPLLVWLASLFHVYDSYCQPWQVSWPFLRLHYNPLTHLLIHLNLSHQ